MKKVLKNSTPPARDDDVMEVDKASTSVGHVAPAQAPEVPPMFKMYVNYCSPFLCMLDKHY